MVSFGGLKLWGHLLHTVTFLGFLYDGQALPGDLSYTWTGLVYYRNNFFCGLYLCVKAGKLLKK